MSNDIANKPLKRIILILEFLSDLINRNPDTETFELRYRHFSNHHKLLGDSLGLDIAFKKITADTAGVISITRHFIPTGKIVGNSEDPSNLTGSAYIVAHIDDPQKLRAYLAETRLAMDREQEETTFELVVRGNKASVTIKGSAPQTSCDFNVGSDRYKIIRFLAEARSYIAAQELAEHLDMTAMQVRAAIDEIRNRISKKLNVSRIKIISNNPKTGEGYGFLNMEIKT